jgi:hypothetical protein
MRIGKVLVNSAVITKGDGIVLKCFVWRYKGNVINGFVWGKCFWRMETLNTR